MRKMREIARICLIVENTGLDPLCGSPRPSQSVACRGKYKTNDIIAQAQVQ